MYVKAGVPLTKTKVLAHNKYSHFPFQCLVLKNLMRECPGSLMGSVLDY